MRFATPIFMLAFCVGASALAVNDDEPVTLMGTIVKWQYPESKLSGGEMADAATMDASGKRTEPSIVLKTTMTTEDSVDAVLKFYRTLLKRDQKIDDKLGTEPETGRSVIFNDESDGRPFAFHTIIVNTSTTSTTLIVTRGADEKETRITWNQYLRHESPPKQNVFFVVDGPFENRTKVHVKTIENTLVSPRTVRVSRVPRDDKVRVEVKFMFNGKEIPERKVRLQVELFDVDGESMGDASVSCTDGRLFSAETHRHNPIVYGSPENSETLTIRLPRADLDQIDYLRLAFHEMNSNEN